MADKNLKFNLDFIAKTAGLKDAAGALDDIGDGLDDDTDYAKKLAKAMKATADAMEADLAKTRAMADKLATALGPDMAQSIGQARLDQFATQLRQAGVDADGLDANIDDISDSLRRMEGAKQSVTDVGTEMDHVRDTTGRANDVMGSFAGNAVTELPGVGEAFGPANEAMSQMVEGLIAGEVGFGNLVAAAGPMLGVAVAVKLVQKYMDEIAKVKAWRKEQVDAFTKSLNSGADVASEFRDRLIEASKVEFHLNRMFGGDALDDIAAAGLSIDDFIRAVMGGDEGIQKLVDAMRAAGVEGGTINTVLQAAKSYQDQYNQAIETHNRLVEVGLAKSDEEIAADKALNRNKDALADTLERIADAYKDARQGAKDYLGATLDLAESVLDLQDAQDDLKTVMEDSESTAADIERANIAVYRAEMNVTQSLEDQSLAFARQQNAGEGSRAEAQLQIYMLEEMRKKYPELSDEIDAYIDHLKSIPGVVNTNLTWNGRVPTAPTSGAVGDTGNIDLGNSGGGRGSGRVNSLDGGRASITNNLYVTGIITPQISQALIDAITQGANDGMRAAWMAVN